MRRTLQDVGRLQTGPSRILVIGESEHDKKTLIDHVCGGGDNNNNNIGGNNDEEERKGSLLPMWMHKGRDQADMIKQVQVELDNVKTRNKIWTVKSIYNLWSVSYKPLTLGDRNHTRPLRDCGIWFHMLWLVYHVGRTSPKFEWKLVASRKQKHLIPVQLLVVGDAEEDDPRGTKFYSDFMSRREYLFPGASEQELGERILRVDVVADEDSRIRLWVACNVVQIRAEMKFAVGVMSRIGKKLGQTGITQIKSFAEHFTKEQVVCKSAAFAFEVFCSLFEVPVDFRAALEERVKSWSPKVEIQAGTPPPNSFMHYCVWLVAVIVYCKSLRPGGWSTFECTRGQYPWTAELDECVDSHLLDLHNREWKDLVDKRKTYGFLTHIFEDTRVRGAKHRTSTLPIASLNSLSHDQRSVSVTETSRPLHVVPPEIPPVSGYEAPAPLWFSFGGLCPTLIYPLLRILHLHRP